MAEAPTPGATTPEQKYPTITVKVDGVDHTLRTSELTAVDSAELRRQTGLSVRLLLVAAGEDPDLDVVAAIVWLARRQAGEKNLKFSKVAAEISYSTEVTPVDDVDEDEVDGPEA